MKQSNYRGGRHKKADPSTAFRCSVNFTASEQARLLDMQEKSGIESLSAFIKMQVFGIKQNVILNYALRAIGICFAG